MNIQPKIGKTIASREGISLFETGKSIKQLQDMVREETLRKASSSKVKNDTLESPAFPGTADNRTMVLEDDEIQVITQESKGKAVGNRTTEFTGPIEVLEGGGAVEKKPDPSISDADGTAALLRTIRRVSGRPPEPEVKLTGARDEKSILFQIDTGPQPERKAGETSVTVSLEELQRIAVERSAEPEEPTQSDVPAAKPKRPESSVEVSLNELKAIEQDRLAAEREAAETAAREEEERRALVEQEARREAERRNKEEDVAARKTEEELAQAVDELLESYPPDEMQEKRSVVHTMGDLEMLLYADFLPENETRWLIPVELSDDPQENERLTKKTEDAHVIQIADRTYYLCAESFGASKAVELRRRGTSLEMERKPRETSVEIKIETDERTLGVPWGNEHTEYTLLNNEGSSELVECWSVLPERTIRWIMPAPEEDANDKISLAIIKKFDNEPVVTLNGKRYYILSSEDGFANARRCARTGNTLNIWPEAMTDYEFMGSSSGSTPAFSALSVVRKETEWPERFYYHDLTLVEKEAYVHYFPDKKPVFMHPFPNPDTAIELEQLMFEEAKKLGAEKISLGGKEFFVVQVDSIATWRQMAIFCPKTRIASRDGNRVSIWEEAGQSLFASNTTFRIAESNARGAPLPPRGSVRPYDNEDLDIELLYKNGKKTRYLYPVPSNVGDIDIELFNNLVQITSAEVRRTQHSPLMCLQGRWYFALEYAYPGSKMTTLEGDKLIVYPDHSYGQSPKDALAKIRAGLVRKRKEQEPSFVTLPSDPMLRRRLMTTFPPGVAKHLYNVDTEDPNYAPLDSDLLVRDGDVESVWRLADHAIPGMTMPVVRNGDKIIPLTTEGDGYESLRRTPTPSLPPNEEIRQHPGHRPGSLARRRADEVTALINDLTADKSEPVMEIGSGDLLIELPEDDGEATKGKDHKGKPRPS